jgi:hypothetical protein
VPFLKLCFAVDFDHAMAYVSERHLSSWQVDIETLEHEARENLLCEGLAIVRAGSITSVLGPEGYVSSWLAVPNALSRSVDRTRPPIVALAPGRDEVRLVGSADRALLVAQVEQATTAYLTGPRKVSPLPYLVDYDRLTPWAATAQHPAAPFVTPPAHLV